VSLGGRIPQTDPGSSDRILARPMKCQSIVSALFLLFAFSALAFTPGADHSLLNASSSTIGIDIRASSQNIDHFTLSPGQSLGIDGEIVSIRLRIGSKAVFRYDAALLQKIVAESGASPKRGGWLIEDAGLRFVPQRGIQLNTPEVPRRMALTIDLSGDRGAG